MRFKKWAIYKSKINTLRAIEYYDKKDDLMIEGLHYIPADSLPVIVNSVGGYSSFKRDFELKNGFQEIIKVHEGHYPLSREQMFPKNSPNFKYGWIDLEGNTYNTGHESHSLAADFICKELKYSSYNSENTLEKLGWVKTTGSWKNGKLEDSVYVEKNIITKKQADTLIDLGLDYLEFVKFYIRNSQNNW
jgi:hypothetical protein